MPRFCDVSIFQDGGRCHLGFSKFQNFNSRDSHEGRNTSLCQFVSKSVQPRPRYRDFSIFQDGGRRHLGFLKFQIFNGRNGQEGQTASLCQISSKLHEPQPRFCDFSIFQDGGRRHLEFSKFQIFNSGTVKKVELRHHSKFRWNRPNHRGRDIVIFLFFKMAAAAILDF